MLEELKNKVIPVLVDAGLLESKEEGEEIWQQLSEKELQNQLYKAVYGQHDASWLSFYDFFKEMFPEEVKPLEGQMEIAQSAGWWWPFNDVCLLTDRPMELHRDAEYRLHFEKGPALLYRDGHGLYVWHGIRVPAEWIEDTENMDPSIPLNWENVEQRRAAAEIIGWDRVLDSLNPEVVDEDPNPEIGTLLRVDLPDAPRSLFLRVKCGTGRDFVLPCVHNEFKTALEANAASWGDAGISPELVKNLQVRT